MATSASRNTHHHTAGQPNEEDIKNFFGKSGHTNNWAVLVCTSRFWFNYRHIANTLAIYRTVKRLGIPDSNIILMLADDMACNPRNKHPGAVFSHPNHEVDIYGDNVEVDYRGYEVTVENFIRLITGRVMPDTPRSKRLLTDDKSNILFYLTGHGGEDFLKFQDAEEINSYDIADAFSQMWEKKRYNEIMFMIDTCQANSMFSKFKSPNILSIGSSRVGESSYSYFHDADLGLTVIDRFTYVNLKYFEDIDMQSRSSFSDLYSTYDTKIIKSNPGYDTRHFKRRFDQTLLTDFLGAVAKAEITEKSYPLQRNITRDTSKTGSNTAKDQSPTSIQSIWKTLERATSKNKKGHFDHPELNSQNMSTNNVDILTSTLRVLVGLVCIGGIGLTARSAIST